MPFACCSPGGELPDDARWQARLEEAVRLRREMLRLDETTDAYRLVHAEADGLSSLVVDRLGNTLSAEVYSLGMYQRPRRFSPAWPPSAGRSTR